MEIKNLKEIWKEQKTASFNKEEILKMLQKRSYSIARWIFYLSVAEFSLFFLASFLLPNNDYQLEGVNQVLSTFINVVNIVLTVFFIILFYVNYKKIKSESNIVMLMKNIIKTRKSVMYYIYSNLILFFFEEVIMVQKLFKDNWNASDPTSVLIVIIPVCLLTLLMFWIYYKIIYGFLLKKLNKNYKEIRQLQ